MLNYNRPGGSASVFGAFAALVLWGPPAHSQFGQVRSVADPMPGAGLVSTADLNGDGSVDILTSLGDEVVWLENLGGGAFGSPQLLAAPANFGSFLVADLDGDGDPDFLGGTFADYQVTWYANLGGGVFGPPQVITNLVDGPVTVFASDLDGDDDLDVLSRSSFDGKLARYTNLGGGVFGPQRATVLAGGGDVLAADLDGDEDPDVLTSHLPLGSMSWFENLGGGSFGPAQGIATGSDEGLSLQVADFNGDGRLDVLGNSSWFEEVFCPWPPCKFYYGGDMRWFENLGGGAFGPAQVITTSPTREAAAVDTDGDGDVDIVAVGHFPTRVAWFENLGDGSFTAPQVLETYPGPYGPYYQGLAVADLSGDGDPDALWSHSFDLLWSENLAPPEVTVYGCGINPADSLVRVSGQPTLGGTTTFALDNTVGTQVSGFAAMAVSTSPFDGGLFPCGAQLLGFGMAPDAVGELLIQVPTYLGKSAGPWVLGAPTIGSVRVPNDATLLDLSVYLQGVILDPTLDRIGLTNAAKLDIGQ